MSEESVTSLEEPRMEPGVAAIDGAGSPDPAPETLDAKMNDTTPEPEPIVAGDDRCEIINKMRSDDVSIGSAEPLPDFTDKSMDINAGIEQDSELPTDPHQLQTDEVVVGSSAANIETLIPAVVNDEETKPIVNGEVSRESTESEFKYQYSDTGYHYYVSTKNGAWYVQDENGYWYTQDADGSFEAYTPNVADEPMPSVPGGERLPPPDAATANGSIMDRSIEPEPPKVNNDLRPALAADVASATPSDDSIASLASASREKSPMIVEPISVADIRMTAATVAATLSDATGDSLTTTAAALQLVPFDVDGRPVYPRRADGKFILPLDGSGKPVFQMDSEGYPMYPIDDMGQPVFPVDERGDPVFGVGVGNKVFVPMDNNDRPIYPLNDDGTPIFPVGLDGKPSVAYSLKTKKPILPLDDAGRPILPVVHAAATPTAPFAHLAPSSVGDASAAAATTPTVVQSAPSMYSNAATTTPTSAAAAATDWNQYWTQYYQQYYQAYGNYYYGAGAAPMMPPPYGLPPTNVPPPSMFSVGYGGAAMMGVNPAAAMTPGVGFGHGFKKLKVRPEDIDLPSGPAPPKKSPVASAATLAPPGTTPATTAATITSSLAGAKSRLSSAATSAALAKSAAAFKTATTQDDAGTKKDATKSLISKQIRAFASMQKFKLERESGATPPTTASATTPPSRATRSDSVKEDEVYGPKVPPPPGVDGSPSASPKKDAAAPIDTRLDKSTLPSPIVDNDAGGGRRDATPEPIRRVSSPVARRKYRSRSSSSSASSKSSRSSSSKTSASRASSPQQHRRRRSSTRSRDGRDEEKVAIGKKRDASSSRASSRASPSPRKPPRRRSRSSYSRSRSKTRSRSPRSRSRSRSRSYSRSPRRYGGPRYGWRGRPTSYYDDRWRGGGGRWRGGGGWRGGPPMGRGGYYGGGGGWRGGRRGSHDWSPPPRRRSNSRSPAKWRKSRSRSASSRSERSRRSVTPEPSPGKVASVAPASPPRDIEPNAAAVVEKSPTRSATPSSDRQRRDLRSPVSSESSATAAAAASPPLPSSSRRRRGGGLVDYDVAESPDKTAATRMTTSASPPRRDEQDMSISSQSPERAASQSPDHRSIGSKGNADTDRSIRRGFDKPTLNILVDDAAKNRAVASHAPESPLLDSLIGDLTVKITSVEDGQVDWPARVIMDTRTVPILRYSCNPISYDSFKVVKRAFDEGQQEKALLAKKSETATAPVFQNKPITFGLSSKFETNLMLQRVTTPSPQEQPSAPKWKPFGFAEATPTTVNIEPEPVPSPEDVKKPFMPRQIVSQAIPPLPASVYTSVQLAPDAELENLRQAALLSMKKAQKDLAYFESVVLQIDMGIRPPKDFLRTTTELGGEREKSQTVDSVGGVEEGELLDDVTNESEPPSALALPPAKTPTPLSPSPPPPDKATSKKKHRKLAKKHRAQKKLMKKEKKRRNKKKRARESDEEIDYLTETSDDDDTGEPKRKRVKVSSETKKRKQRKRDKKRRHKKRSSSVKRRRDKKHRRRRGGNDEKSRRHRRHRRRRSSTSSDDDDFASSADDRRRHRASASSDDDVTDDDDVTRRRDNVADDVGGGDASDTGGDKKDGGAVVADQSPIFS